MDPFATLGLPRCYEIDVQQLETRYRELQKVLHPDRHAGAGAAQRTLSLGKAIEVNDAYRTLKDELRRAEVLLALHRAGASLHEAAPERAEDAEFLMEMLELREALGEAKIGRDLARVRALSDDVERMQRQSREQLVEVFDGLAQTATAAGLAKAAALVGRLNYFRRFLDEVSVIEEEALG